MKKLLLSLLTIAASFTASAESITALFGSADNDNWDNTIGYTTLVESKDGLWAHQNFHNNKNGWGYIKCGRKNVASIGSIYTNTSRTEKIKEVVVTIDAVTSASVNNAALYISADKTNWGNAYKTVTSVSKGDLTFTIDNPQADLYYKVSFDCKASSSNGIVQVSKFTLNYDAEDPDKAPCGLAYETTEFTVAADQTFEKPTLTNPNELPVYYVSSNNDVATVNALTGDVTLTGIAGKTIISANFDGNDTFNPGSAKYTLNVTSAPYHTLKDLVTKGQDGEEFTAVGNFAVLYQKDKYLLLTDGTSNVLAFFNSTITSYEVGTPISAINGKVTIFNGLFEITDFTLTEGGEGAEITPTEITSLSGITPENNLFDLVTVTGDISNVNGSNATLTVGEETIALFNRFTLENFANCSGATVTGFVWVYNGTRQICPNAIVEPEKKADAELSFDGQASYELILGYNVSSFVAPKLNNPNGVTVTYSS
ncbi:MAG: hypothetical protein K2F96_03640, partial [Muribaculaceae bacterium]|nr:hypothetical protein [Muribaculaceae bacterium]